MFNVLFWVGGGCCRFYSSLLIRRHQSYTSFIQNLTDWGLTVFWGQGPQNAYIRRKLKIDLFENFTFPII